jgi:hypothetical protein
LTPLLVAVVAGAWWVVRAQTPDCRAVGDWTCGADMPTLRSELQGAASDGRIYLAGGFGLGGRVVNT